MCCAYDRWAFLYGPSSPQMRPLGFECGSSSPAGYIVAVLVIVIIGGFLGVVVIAYRQFQSRASLYSQLSLSDDDDLVLFA